MAAGNVVRDNTDIDRLDKYTLLLMLDGQDLESFLKRPERFLQVTAILIVVLRAPAPTIRLVHGRLLDF